MSLELPSVLRTVRDAEVGLQHHEGCFLRMMTGMQTEDGSELMTALEESAAALRETVARVSDESARAKPSSEKWSVLEIVEHVSVVDEILSARIGSTEPVAEKIVIPETGSVIFSRVVDRGTVLNAPEFTHPKGRFTSVSEALANFDQVRGRVASILGEKEQVLRYVPVPHPFFGTVSGYEGFVLIAAHAHRHIGQIKEILISLEA